MKGHSGAPAQGRGQPPARPQTARAPTAGGARNGPTHRPTLKWRRICGSKYRDNGEVTLNLERFSPLGVMNSAKAAPPPAVVATTTAVNPQNGRAKPTASWEDKWAPANMPPVGVVNAARCARPARPPRGGANHQCQSSRAFCALLKKAGELLQRGCAVQAARTEERAARSP